ncbi:MAG: hypothetical protein WDO56_32845 [Gammaproteobacteria bacterium]
MPVKRSHLIYGKILAACAFMTISLVVSVTALSIVLRFIGLEGLGMSVNFGPLTALEVILCCLPLVPLGASLMTIIAAYTHAATVRRRHTWVLCCWRRRCRSYSPARWGFGRHSY